MRWVRPLALASGLGACAAPPPPPPPGMEMRAEITFVHRPETMARTLAVTREPERSHMESSGFAAAVREGRAVRLRCAWVEEGMLVADAIAPPGFPVVEGQLVRVVLGSSAPKGVPNRIIGPLADPEITRGSLLRDGNDVHPTARAGVPIEGPIEAWLTRHYLRVRANFLLRCRLPG